jgi:uncharacterized protein YwgA
MLFIAFEGAPRGLDPVRLQKGLFIFAAETDVPAAEKYEFRPYNYGPMSRDIYGDVDQLVAEGLVERVPVEGQSWSRYRPTRRGVERGSELLADAKARHLDAARKLYDTKGTVASMTFDALLEDVYDRYPDYATQSVFRRRA